MFNKIGSGAMIHRVLVRVLLLLSLVGIVAACGPGSTTNSTSTPTTTSPTQQASIPKVTITVKEFSFALPASIQAGFEDITVVNAGAQGHDAQFARLNDGVTLDQVKAALKKDPNTALSLVAANGGINLIKSGQSGEIILDFTAGQYAVLDLLSGSNNGPPKLAAIQSFMVTGPSNEAQVSPPKADVEVGLKEFSFVLPSTVKSGLLTYKVTNQGSQVHHMLLLKLKPGKTLKDIIAALKSSGPSGPSGPPPGDFVGGLDVLSPGKTAWLMMNLAPGNYVALCFLPDKATGKPHAALGMVAGFTVQ